jgi:hypothetical protein
LGKSFEGPSRSCYAYDAVIAAREAVAMMSWRPHPAVRGGFWWLLVLITAAALLFGNGLP